MPIGDSLDSSYSRTLDGSDAMNVDPDYSAAYVVLKTDSRDGVEGHGLTFTCGRGNEVCVAAIEALKHHLDLHRRDAENAEKTSLQEIQTTLPMLKPVF